MKRRNGAERRRRGGKVGDKVASASPLLPPYQGSFPPPPCLKGALPKKREKGVEKGGMTIVSFLHLIPKRREHPAEGAKKI